MNGYSDAMNDTAVWPMKLSILIPFHANVYAMNAIRTCCLSNLASAPGS